MPWIDNGTRIFQIAIVVHVSILQAFTKSLFYKKVATGIYILSLFMAGYMYWRHNKYCEPGGKISSHVLAEVI